MQPEERALLKALLVDQRVLSLAVLVDGAPYAALLPFAAEPDLSALLIHASNLARHTRGLGDDAPFSAVIHRPDSPALDPLQTPRVTILGAVSPLAKDSEAYAAGRALYTAKFPTAAPLFALADFNLYALAIRDCRFVVGFARALNVSLEALRSLAAE